MNKYMLQRRNEAIRSSDVERREVGDVRTTGNMNTKDDTTKKAKTKKKKSAKGKPSNDVNGKVVASILIARKIRGISSLAIETHKSPIPP